MRILPQRGRSVLEIGARDGHITRLLANRYSKVTALDLEKPDFDIPGVESVQGDVTRLDFPDDCFDCVVCTEVLEHIVQVQRAADEISRVAECEIVVGVPYRQDVRLGRTTCRTCGKPNPPWGHVNSFDERSLAAYFPGFDVSSTSYVWTNRDGTNRVSTWLMDLAENPWGTYDQDEPCIHCGARLVRPDSPSIPRRLLASTAHRLQRCQSNWTQPRANWIHMVLRKRRPIP